MNVQSALQTAIAHHQAGRLADAEAIYRDVLARFPQHPDALHFLGLLAHHRGHNEVAVDLMNQALRVAPRHAPCHGNLGNALLALGQLDAAITSYRRALTLERNFAEAHLNLGIALEAKGLLDEAVESFRQAIRIRPQYIEAHNHLGNALLRNGKLDQAMASYQQVLAIQPDYAEAHNNLGLVFQAQGLPDAAIKSLQRALAIRPDYAEAHNNLGSQFEGQGLLAQALASYQRALALKPDLAEAHNNVGNLLQADGRLEESIASYQHALAIRPNYADALNNLGNALQAAGRLDEAVSTYDAALALRPDFADAQWNKSFALLLKGDFAAGWALFECRWQLLAKPADPRQFSQPLWLGDSSLEGRTILLHHEQGLGDTLQMLRYVPLLAGQGARVIVRVPPVLAALAASVPGVGLVVVEGEALPAFDLHCPCMSLPLATKTTLKSIPADVPYLFAPESARATWATRLGGRTRRRIGLVWSGSAAHRNDRQRSLALRQLQPLLALDAEFHSLQKEYRPDDQAVLASDGRLRDWSAQLGDFADTAGLLGQLELVITVDTAVAHLAGALGKPVWLLLPFAPDYRWLLQRTDSPWYPGMRLFRQPVSGDWESVIRSISSATWPEAPCPQRQTTDRASRTE